MTYCLAIQNNDGLVFCADTRTNAGMDNVCTYKKSFSFDIASGSFTILTAGNLATTQALVRKIETEIQNNPEVINNNSLFNLALMVGKMSNEIQDKTCRNWGFDAKLPHPYGASFIMGGTINGVTEFYKIYQNGFVEMPAKNNEGVSYFEIGDPRFGNPIVNHFLSKKMSIEDMARVGVFALENTISNLLTTGFPIDLCVMQNGSSQRNEIRLIESHPFIKELKSSVQGQNIANLEMDQMPRLPWEGPINQGRFNFK